MCFTTTKQQAMIKFFRHIRQRLLTENKFSKYLLYAIGEIVLVVIGILIALQLNNWNYEKNDRLMEVKILTEIRKNLDFDLFEINEDITLMDSIAHSCDNVIAVMQNSDSPTKRFEYELAKLRVTPHFDPNMSGYELLVSKGVELVTNDSLRKAISALYESRYPYYARYEQERIDFIEQNLEPILLDHVTFIAKPDVFFLTSAEITIADFERLKQNEAFLKMVGGVAVENMFVKDRAQRAAAEIKNVTELIDQELENRP
jgi:hypothetical protein